MQKPRRYFAVFGAGVFVAFFLTILVLAVTGPGQRILLKGAAWVASSDTLSVEIGQLDGSLFSEGRIARISLADADGVWAELDEISFAWSPWSLAGGALNVEKLHVAKVTLTREPHEPPNANVSEGPSDRTGQFAIPPLRVASFAIDEAMLGDAILGEKARFSLKGDIQATDTADQISGSLLLTDLDRPGFIKARATYQASGGKLEITAEAKEDQGGVLSTLLDIRDSAGLLLAVNGSGPIEDWRGDWSLVSGGERNADGTVRFNRQTDGLHIATTANGEISRFMPEPYAALLKGKSSVIIEARILGQDRYCIDKLQLTAPQMTANLSVAVDSGTSYLSGSGDIRVRSDTGEPIVLALGQGRVFEVGNAEAVFAVKPGQGGIAFSGDVDATNLVLDGNRVGRITIRLSANQPNDVTQLLGQLEAIAVSAVTERVETADAALRPLIGDRVTLQIAGSKFGATIAVAGATLSAGLGSLSTKGEFDEKGYDGNVVLSVPDAAALSQLAERSLTGKLLVEANGRANFDGSLDVALNGAAERVSAGEDLLAKVLAGNSSLGGKVARDDEGAVRFDALNLRTSALTLDLNGSLGTESSDLKLKSQIAELAQLLPNSSGALTLDASIGGSDAARNLIVNVSAKEAAFGGKSLRDVTLSYEGIGGIDSQNGVFSANGKIGDALLKGGGQLAYAGAGGLTVRGLVLTLGENRIEAEVSLPDAGDAQGKATLTIADASQLAPFLGVPLEGRANIEAQLDGAAETPRIVAKADSNHFRFDTVELKDFVAALEITDALERPVLSGNAQIKALASGQTRMSDLSLSAKPESDRTEFTLRARADDRWQIGGQALVSLTGWQPEGILRDISIRNGSTTIGQEGTAQLTVKNGGLRLNGLVVTSGKGRIGASVNLDDTLSGKIDVKQFPASIAGLFAPDLAPQGTIDGTVELAGSASAPEIGYQLSWNEASAKGALPPQLPALNLSATGALSGDNLTIDGAATGSGGLNLKAKGALREVSSAANLGLKATGSVPLGIADGFLATRGTRLDGSATIDLAISGQATAPKIDGRITASGASVTDPPTGVNLKDAALTARLSGGTLRIETLTASSEKGGNLSASGTIGILDAKTLPADLQIKANALRFNDQRLIAGEVGSDLSFKGDLNGQSKLSGTIDLARLDIQIPRSMPASVEALELKHKNAPDHVAATYPSDQPERNNTLPSTIKLSLAIRSANRIFVTGRGLDAQLGGALQVLGSADRPRALGEFTLERGRLALLGRTLEFVSGSVNFTGDLDPVLNFLAATEVDGTKIEVTVSGQASDPKFSFASTPELPEDEILALLLFNKSLGELSPLQIAQLASEVSELGGLTGGPGILGRLKSSVGIDTLNVTTDENGEAAVSAGSYVNDKVFVGVEQGSSSDSSRVKVDLDITKNLKLRGEAGADGNSKLGVGVEWEY